MERTKIKAQAPPIFVINALNGGDIGLFKPAIEKNILIFDIDKRQKLAAGTLLDKKNVKFDILGERGIKTGAKKLFLRIGMWAGIAIGLALIFIYSAMLTRITIEGADLVSEDTIIAATGIVLPAMFADPDTEAIEKALVALDGISGATVVRRGTTLKIKVIEELTDTEIIDTVTPAPIIASEDGVVRRIIVVQGTAAVKAGDTVRKGDTLIKPYTQNAEGNQIAVRAMGEVIADVYYQRHTVYSDRVIGDVRTGASETFVTIELPGLDYNKKCSFASFETEVKTYACPNVLPFKIVKTICYETRKEETDFDFGVNMERLIEENFNALSATLPADATPVKWWYLVKRLDKNTVLSIYYQIERSVGVRPPQ